MRDQDERTDLLAASLALPGEGWAGPRERAKRLLSAVRQCVPCLSCDPEDCASYREDIGWIDDGGQWCRRCDSLSSAIEELTRQEVAMDLP